MTPAAMATVLTRIKPTLSYGDFKAVDLVVEAVSENEKVKKAVLAEVEGHQARRHPGQQHLLHLHHPPGRAP